jgi:NAD(P)-dependent dehydrogenase (short-subunit alcohol dehydrogenase family)
MNQGSVVLVTGCSSGIGRATALALVKAGCVTWASARHVDTLADLQRAGCRTVELDVTDEESRLFAVRTIEAEHGGIDVLVNNAGYSQPGAVEEVSLDAFQRQFDVNVFGLIRMCQLVIPEMRSKRSGTIVNLGSGAGLVTPPLSSAYAMSKYSLEALSDSLRFELRPFGIRTILIEPAAINTGFTDTLESVMPRLAGGPYGAVTSNVLGFARREGESGIAAEAVARVIVNAVGSQSPRARYKVGSQARVAPLVRRLVGDRLWDLIMARLVPAT